MKQPTTNIHAWKSIFHLLRIPRAPQPSARKSLIQEIFETHVLVGSSSSGISEFITGNPWKKFPSYELSLSPRLPNFSSSHAVANDTFLGVSPLLLFREIMNIDDTLTFLSVESGRAILNDDISERVEHFRRAKFMNFPLDIHVVRETK